LKIDKSRLLEIYDNPRDLYLTITGNNAGYGFMITRGPETGFEPIVTALPQFATRNDALDRIKTFLQQARAAAAKPEELAIDIRIAETCFDAGNDIGGGHEAKQHVLREDPDKLTSLQIAAICAKLSMENSVRTYEANACVAA
jgi:hypothetical protein